MKHFQDALATVEQGAQIWQEDHPGQPAIFYIVGAGEFVAQQLATVTDESFEAFLATMRKQRYDHRSRRAT